MPAEPGTQVFSPSAICDAQPPAQLGACAVAYDDTVQAGKNNGNTQTRYGSDSATADRVRSETYHTLSAPGVK